MGSLDLRVVKTRAAIKNSLIELMSEKQLSDITVSELAQRAQVNRKTFYRHYGSVAQVKAELENDVLSEFADIMRQQNTSCLDIGTVFRDITALIGRRREYYQKLMKLNPELFNQGRVKAMLRRTIEVSLRGVGGITDKAVLESVSGFIVSGVLSLYADWFDGGCTGSLEQITQTACRMTTSGLKGFISDEKLISVSLK
ncbi:MAG: TetR/AcrR family transcriptional regulator [Oscillospiraceae bacterium]